MILLIHYLKQKNKSNLMLKNQFMDFKELLQLNSSFQIYADFMHYLMLISKV